MADTVDAATAGAAVEWTNVKNLGDMTPLVAGLSAQNALAFQQRANNLALELQHQASLTGQQLLADAAAFRQALLSKSVKFIFDESTSNAAALQTERAMTLQEKIAEVGASLSSVQSSAKQANTVPPQTGTGGAFGSDAGSALLQQLVNAQAVIAQAVSGQTQTLSNIQALLQSLASQQTPNPIGK